MKHIKFSATLLLLAASLVLVSSTPALAHQGSHDDSSSTSGSETSSGNSGSGHTSSHSTTITKTSHDGTEVEVEHTSEVEVHHSSLSELKQKASSDLSQRKQNRKAQTDDQRKKVCEARKEGLETRSSRIVSNSQRLQKRIDGVLQKAIDYKTNNNLQVADWDSLLAAAQSAQSASNTSIASLQSVKPSVDCNNSSVASDVATFKVAAAETRDNLKAYRDAVKAVLKALAEVKASNSTEGSN